MPHAQQLNDIANKIYAAGARYSETDEEGARRLASQMGLRGDWKQSGGDGKKDGPEIDGKAMVNGPAEQKHDDLGATIPGTGIRLGGDGVSEPGKSGSNYPRIHIPVHDGVPEFDGPNPLPVRGSHPLTYTLQCIPGEYQRTGAGAAFAVLANPRADSPSAEAIRVEPTALRTRLFFMVLLLVWV